MHLDDHPGQKNHLCKMCMAFYELIKFNFYVNTIEEKSLEFPVLYIWFITFALKNWLVNITYFLLSRYMSL